MDNNQQNMGVNYLQNPQQNMPVNQQYGGNPVQQNYGYTYPPQNINANNNEYGYNNRNNLWQQTNFNSTNTQINSYNPNLNNNQTFQNPALKMNYYNFLTRFSMGIICLWFLLRGFMAFTAHELGDSKDYVFERYKNIKATYNILGILYFAIAVAVVIAWIGLIKYRKYGSEVLMYCIFADAVLRIAGVAVLAKQIGDIVGENAVNTQEAYSSQFIWVFIDIIFIVFTNSYFKKRKQMFS